MLQTPRNQVLLFSALLLTGAIFSGTVLVGGKGGKGGKGTPASFTVTFSGNVLSKDEAGDCSGNRITERSNQIVINPVDLDLKFFFAGDGEFCFNEMWYEDVMAISEEKDGSILADFYFDARTVDLDPIRYRLQMWGYVVKGDDWLPANNSTIELTDWKMGTDTKGPRKNACTGEGMFDTTLTVDRVDGAPTC